MIFIIIPINFLNAVKWLNGFWAFSRGNGFDNIIDEKMATNMPHIIPYRYFSIYMLVFRYIGMYIFWGYYYMIAPRNLAGPPVKSELSNLAPNLVHNFFFNCKYSQKFPFSRVYKTYMNMICKEIFCQYAYTSKHSSKCTILVII